MKTFIVSKNNTANSYPTISDALCEIEKLPSEEPVTLEIEPGIYHEKLEIRRSNLTILGTGTIAADVVLTYDDFAFDSMPDGTKRGTFRSYSVLLDADRVTVKNLTIENASGDENTHGQAIALYAEGDMLEFENVRLLGRQDTLFTGPLPPKEMQPGGFIGPKQFAPRINGRQHYKNCYLCGNVDFIFGSSTAVFEDCVIESLAHKEDPNAIQGYVSAPSTPEGQKYGYLFVNCKFISTECAPKTCYLMRPWREFAKTVFVHCAFGPHIHPDAFHDWNKPNSHTTALFGMFECHSINESGTVIGEFVPNAAFSTLLTKEQAEDFLTNSLAER